MSADPQVDALIDDLQHGDSGAAIRAAHALGRLGSAAVEPLLSAVGDKDMLQRFRLLQARGEWRDSDAGLLVLQLTRRTLEARGFMG